MYSKARHLASHQSMATHILPTTQATYQTSTTTQVSTTIAHPKISTTPSINAASQTTTAIITTKGTSTPTYLLTWSDGDFRYGITQAKLGNGAECEFNPNSPNFYCYLPGQPLWIQLSMQITNDGTRSRSTSSIPLTIREIDSSGIPIAPITTVLVTNNDFVMPGQTIDAVATFETSNEFSSVLTTGGLSNELFVVNYLPVMLTSDATLVAASTTPIDWSTAVALINACQVERIHISQGTNQYGQSLNSTSLYLNSKQTIDLTNRVSYQVAQQAVQAVSSTCGTVPIGVTVYN